MSIKMEIVKALVAMRDSPEQLLLLINVAKADCQGVTELFKDRTSDNNNETMLFGLGPITRGQVQLDEDRLIVLNSKSSVGSVYDATKATQVNLRIKYDAIVRVTVPGACVSER